MMKKVLSLVLVLAMVTALLAPLMVVHGEENGDYCYQFENVEIIFDTTTKLNALQREAVAARLAEGSSDGGVAKYNFLCTLFGHDYYNQDVKKVIHEVYSVAPRCVQELYSVNVCERCENIETELIYTERIDCCP